VSQVPALQNAQRSDDKQVKRMRKIETVPAKDEPCAVDTATHAAAENKRAECQCGQQKITLEYSMHDKVRKIFLRNRIRDGQVLANHAAASTAQKSTVSCKTCKCVDSVAGTQQKRPLTLSASVSQQ